jgi:beta-glucanase (GH16 family)
VKKQYILLNAILLIIISSLFVSCNNNPGEEIIREPSDTPDTYTPPPGLTLTWSDEFDGPDINLDVWSYETEENGWSHTWNNEWQRYTDNGTGGENAFIEDSILTIKAIKTTGGDGGYTSARMITKDFDAWQYGTIAARIQMPYGQGVWPAFWMLGETGQWPASGEIDIVEMIGGGIQDYTTHATLHWDEPEGTHKSYGGDYEYSERLADEWHYYECEWSSDEITIRFDDAVVMTMSITGVEKSEFRQPFYILLNLAIGGNWPGDPDETTVFPQYMFIDWVRVYQ